MIDKITIENYKSIQKLDIPLGRVNVFIGANGSGKSNLLEAIVFGAAAATNKLDSEYLSIRGIRVADPRLMRNAFDISDTDKEIKISFNKGSNNLSYELMNNNEQYSKWEIRNGRSVTLGELLEYLHSQKDSLQEIADKEVIDQELIQNFLRAKYPISEFENFVIYSPENNELRKFDNESQLEPLGKYGEGLFKLVKSMKKEEINALKANLEMIDWFEDFYIEDGLLSNEKKIQLKDRFLDEAIHFFDQRSANEGFLFLLFYLSLFISKHTPRFFAIDNIDNALNPKLCKDLMKSFITLSEQYQKQVILTTHNPTILDGLNLNDPTQKLYVVFRNMEGKTKIKEINNKNFNTESKVRLSEAFVRGYIGGLNQTLI